MIYCIAGYLRLFIIFLSQGSGSGIPTMTRQMDPSMHPLRNWTLL